MWQYKQVYERSSVGVPGVFRLVVSVEDVGVSAGHLHCVVTGARHHLHGPFAHPVRRLFRQLAAWSQARVVDCKKKVDICVFVTNLLTLKST